jgi:Ca2+:H+ antiporter
MIRQFAPLLSVPLSLALHYWNLIGPVWIFLSGLVAIAVLADWVRRGTEQVAAHAGPTIGSLLNVSFGNASELVLALFVLSQADARVVQAQITGSIIGTTLLFLGVSALVGGLRFERQTFNRARMGQASTLLLLVAIAILLPATFDMTERATSHATDLSLLDERLSLCCAVVLLLLYFAHLIYVLMTKRKIIDTGEPGGAVWSLSTGLGVMVAGTVVIAVESEVVTARLAEASRARAVADIHGGSRAGVGRNYRRPVHLGCVRAQRPDGHRDRHLHRFGAADRPGGRARSGAGRLGNRSSDDPGVW